MASRISTPKHSHSDIQDQQKKAKQAVLKKVLDKVGKVMYNNPIGLQGDLSPCYTLSLNQTHEAFPSLPYSKERSRRTFDFVKILLQDVGRECFKQGFPKPILMGGSVRDIVCGMVPKDYDIFIDVSSVEDDLFDMDDLVYLLADKAFDKSEGWKIEKGGKTYGPAHSWFLVYNALLGEGDIKVQIIAHKDPRIHENTLDFVSEFPYNLVKGWIEDGNIHLHKDAYQGFMNKTISYENDSAYTKAALWTYRLGTANRKMWTFSSKGKKGTSDIYYEMLKDQQFLEGNIWDVERIMPRNNGPFIIRN